jgi:HSP20 family molecular chaperone IbpA
MEKKNDVRSIINWMSEYDYRRYEDIWGNKLPFWQVFPEYTENPYKTYASSDLYLTGYEKYSFTFKEEKDRYEVTVTSPGIKKKDIDVSLVGSQLLVKYMNGDKANWEKSFLVDKASTKDGCVDARYEDGILYVTALKDQGTNKKVVVK